MSILEIIDWYTEWPEALRDCVKTRQLQDVEIFARRLILFCNASSMQMKYPSVSLLRANHLT